MYDPLKQPFSVIQHNGIESVEVQWCGFLESITFCSSIGLNILFYMKFSLVHSHIKFIHDHTHTYIHTYIFKYRINYKANLLLIYSPIFFSRSIILIFPKVFSTLGNTHSIARSSEQISIHFLILIDQFYFAYYSFLSTLYEAGFLFCLFIFFLFTERNLHPRQFYTIH